MPIKQSAETTASNDLPTEENDESESLGQYLGRYFRNTARLMVGIPDYEVYKLHYSAIHPDLPVPSYEEFFKERQLARYAGGGKRGCPC